MPWTPPAEARACAFSVLMGKIGASFCSGWLGSICAKVTLRVCAMQICENILLNNISYFRFRLIHLAEASALISVQICILTRQAPILIKSTLATSSSDCFDDKQKIDDFQIKLSLTHFQKPPGSRKSSNWFRGSVASSNRWKHVPLDSLVPLPAANITREGEKTVTTTVVLIKPGVSAANGETPSRRARK